MEKFIEASPGWKVDILSDQAFRVFAAREGQPTFLVGPAQSDLRRTRLIVPEGCNGFVIETDADARVETDVITNASHFEPHDPERLLKELDDLGPRHVSDVIANEIRRELIRRGLTDDPPETVEEANDFDMPDDDLHPWEVIYRDLEPEPYAETRADDSPEPAPVAETASEDDEQEVPKG